MSWTAVFITYGSIALCIWLDRKMIEYQNMKQALKDKER